MSEWKQCCLADVTESLDSLRKPVKGSERNLGQYPYYGASGIVDYVDDYLFDGLYLLVAEDGENLKTRKTPIAFLANGKFWVNNHAHVLKENGKSNIRFLSYALQVADIHSFLTGSTIPKLTKANLDKIPIYLPNKKEQSVIAEVLGALDDKIELNRKMNATLEAMARALFKSWFVDFDPVRAKSEGREPFGMDADTAALFPSRLVPSALGDIPEGWERRSLSQTANFLNGLALQKFPATGAEFLPVIKIAQIRQGNASDGADKASASIPEAYIVNNGDVLFSWSGSLLQVLWTGGKGALNQHLFKVTSDKYPKWFYYLWVDEHMAWFQSVAASKATTMGHIQRMHLDQASVLVPPKALLKKMDDMFAPSFTKRLELGIENKKLLELRDYLLPKLISGEIRIPDAEKMVGGA